MSDYDWTPAGQLQRSLGMSSQPSRGRTESEQRALRAEYEQTMERIDPGWARRQEEIAAFAVEIRSRGAWISSVGACPQCSAEERGAPPVDRLDHDCRISDLKLQERLRSQTRIAEAERSGAIGPMTPAQVGAHNAARMAAAQARQDRLGGLAGTVA